MDRFLPDLVRDEDYPLTFGRYTLTGLLGEGGMARVFRGQLGGAQGFRKSVAIKVIRAAVASQNEHLKRALLHEGRIGGLLHHPNLVEVYECGEMEGFPFIAMELVEGVGLDILVEKVKPLPPKIVLTLVRQMCAGLHHAHEFEKAGVAADLVHRDLKPSNLMLSRNGIVKIADFGIAKAGDMTGNTTATGIAKGTPAYMSPQQANAERVDRRSDIFALGAVLYELATGQRLFRGETLVSTLMAVLRVEERLANPHFEELLEGVVPGLAEVVRTCLRKDPAARYPSCEHLDAALRSLEPHVPGAPPLKRWLHGVTPELEKSLEDIEAPRARAAIAHLTRDNEPTLDDRTERIPQAETRPATEPVAVPRRGGARWIAVGGALLLLLGLAVALIPGGGGEEEPELADLAIAPKGGAEGAAAGDGEAGGLDGQTGEDGSVDGAEGAEGAEGAVTGAESAAESSADPAAADEVTGLPSLSVSATPTPKPARTPRPTPKPRSTPAPTPTPAAVADSSADERPDDVPAWEPDPEPTPTPRTGTKSTAPRVSREALEKASRDRKPNTSLLKEKAFRITNPRARHEKQGRKWKVTVSARVAGSRKVKATLHLRAGSGRWSKYELERSGSDVWSTTISLPNTVASDIQYWIEAENLANSDSRTGRQRTTLGSEYRPQFHYLN